MFASLLPYWRWAVLEKFIKLWPLSRFSSPHLHWNLKLPRYHPVSSPIDVLLLENLKQLFWANFTQYLCCPGAFSQQPSHLDGDRRYGNHPCEVISELFCHSAIELQFWFIYSMKNVGLTTLPWDMPSVWSFVSDRMSLTLTLKDMGLRNSCMKINTSFYSGFVFVHQDAVSPS